MPSITQYTLLPYTDIAETFFLGGTAKFNTTSRMFQTQSGDYTVTFLGTGLTYALDGSLTGGTLTGYSVRQDVGSSSIGVLYADSNFTLLTFVELNQVFALAASGNLAAAVAQVTASWIEEFFWHTNYGGGYLHGYSGDESLFGSGLADQIHGLDGGDFLVMGTGNDEGFGGAGNDRIHGDDGDDTLNGGDGSDTMLGGNGNDQITDADGANYISGGKGDDLIQAGTGADVITGERGNDILSGGAGDDDLSGDQDDDAMDGGDGNDQLSGDGGNDNLTGGAGNDLLRGGGGDDQINGGDGNDRIAGGAGADLLSGGTGLDIFIFVSGAPAADTILDFEDDADMIRLVGFGFQDAAAALSAAQETGGHVTFNLGLGQTLTVMNTTLAALSDDLVVA